MWALAQRISSSVIIITSWHLHVRVFAVGESTGDESTYCIVIQRTITWNCHKSQTTTNCRSKTRVHKAIKEITLRPVHCWIQRSEHDGTENTVTKLNQWQKMEWQSFLKDSNLLDQGLHPILLIRCLTTCVTVDNSVKRWEDCAWICMIPMPRQHAGCAVQAEEAKTRARWAASVTKPRIGTRMSTHVERNRVVHVTGNSARDCTDIEQYRKT